MKTIIVDKIASITQACGLGHELRVSGDSSGGGVVIVAEVLTTNRPTTLQLTSGRMISSARATS
jgi:hypothetical protein